VQKRACLPQAGAKALPAAGRRGATGNWWPVPPEHVTTTLVAGMVVVVVE